MKKIILIFCFIFFQLDADTIFNGYGSGNIILSEDSELFIENNTTTTLKNITLKNLSEQRLVMGGSNSVLALENTTIFLDGDYSFTQGYLYIHHDVKICGTSNFNYLSTQSCYIDQFSKLYFDFDTTFNYAITAESFRELIHMTDNTSKLHLNGCSLYSTSTGMKLTSGQVFFDNLVTLSSGGQTVEEAMLFQDDCVVTPLSGACVEVYGQVDFK